MNKISKILAVIFTVAIAFLAFSSSSFAVATELEAGNSKENAVNIPEFDVEYVSELSVSTEYDWFKFTTISEEAFYSVSFKLYSLPSGSGGSFAPWVFLYDKNLQEIESNYNNRIFSHKLEKNSTYYIMVRNGSFHDCTGTYEVKVSYKLDEAGSNQTNAKLIDINETVHSSLDGYNDVDCFTFIAPVSGEYKFSLVNCNIGGNGTSANFALNLYLYDKYDKSLGQDYCRGNFGTAQFSTVLEAGENYYLKVLHRISTSLGNYELKVTCDIPEDENDEGNNKSTLTSISIVTAPQKTVYSIGESFNADGLSVEAIYSDGTNKTVEDYSITGFDSSTAGTKKIIVSYTENDITKNDSFEVIVEEDDQNDGFFIILINLLVNFFMTIISIFTGLIN